MEWIIKCFHSHGFRFILIGALLFGLQQFEQKYFFKQNSVNETEIVIRKDQIEQFKVDIKAQTGLEPGHQQIQAAIDMAIDDEVLYRQALNLKLDHTNVGVRHRLVQIAKFVNEGSSLSVRALYQKALELGLDRSDPVVRRLLIANMKLIAAKVPSNKVPSRLTPEQIQTYFDKNKIIFEKPERISFSHIYVSRDKWGKKGDLEAQRLLKALQSKQVQPPLQANMGDLFLMGNHFSASSPSLLQRYFGSEFVSQVFKLDAGKWQGPVASGYGWHLVLVEEIIETQALTLHEVLNQVEGNILQEREVIRLNDALSELRSHYKIRIESAEDFTGMEGAGCHACS